MDEINRQKAEQRALDMAANMASAIKGPVVCDSFGFVTARVVQKVPPAESVKSDKDKDSKRDRDRDRSRDRDRNRDRRSRSRDRDRDRDRRRSRSRSRERSNRRKSKEKFDNSCSQQKETFQYYKS